MTFPERAATTSPVTQVTASSGGESILLPFESVSLFNNESGGKDVLGFLNLGTQKTGQLPRLLFGGRQHPGKKSNVLRARL